MLRLNFFSRKCQFKNTRELAQAVIPAKETTNDQFKRLRQNPKFADTLAEMQQASKRVKDNNYTKLISSEELAKLLDLEKESTKFSIY